MSQIRSDATLDDMNDKKRNFNRTRICMSLEIQFPFVSIGAVIGDTQQLYSIGDIEIRQNFNDIQHRRHMSSFL